MNKTILEEIDSVVLESDIEVLESLCCSYDKAYEILESSVENDVDMGLFTIVQESETGDNEDIDGDEKEAKKGNVIGRLINAIIGFFKAIGNAIKNFFKKTKATVSEKLRKLSSKSATACEAVQDKIDDNPTVENKLDKISDKFEEKKPAIPEEYIDNQSIDVKSEEPAEEAPKEEPKEEPKAEEPKEEPKKEKKEKKAKKVKKAKEPKSENKTKIVVKEKKVKTHIIFSAWINFLEYSLAYTERVSETTGAISPASFKSAIVNRPSRSIDAGDRDLNSEVTQVQGKLADLVGDIKAGKNVRKARLKKRRLFSGFCKKYPVSEVADNLDKINALLEKNIKSADKAYEKFDKLKQVYTSGPNNKVYNKIIKDITKIHTELVNIGRVTILLTSYLGAEFGLYDAMLNIIIPMFDDAIDKAEKEAAKNNPTVNVNVKTVKDED